MADTFIWSATSSSRGTRTAKVNKAQFGDGYTQSAADGINSVSSAFAVTFMTDRQAEALAIDQFLGSHCGLSFSWSDPLRGAGLYQCETWDVQKNGHMWTINATFQQTFQP